MFKNKIKEPFHTLGEYIIQNKDSIKLGIFHASPLFIVGSISLPLFKNANNKPMEYTNVEIFFGRCFLGFESICFTYHIKHLTQFLLFKYKLKIENYEIKISRYESRYLNKILTPICKEIYKKQEADKVRIDKENDLKKRNKLLSLLKNKD